MNAFKAGTVEGTGSAINVSVGFKPDYVKLFNLDDAGGLAPTMEWFKGMPAASGLKGLKITDSGTSGNASQAKVTSNGISMYDGDDTHAPGFTIGADSDINANGETICYIAVRNIEGA